MARTTKRTMRRYPATARALIESANELDKLSRRLRRMAETVREHEAATEALSRYMAHLAKTESEAEE